MKRISFLLVLAGLAMSLQAQLNPNNARGFDPEKVYQLGDIDHVNLFNGNLLVTLPIGQKYRVSDHLSWGLTLVYNGNPWNYRVDQNAEPIPSRFMNAGLGWQLSLGELVGSYDTLSPSTVGEWLYAAPDGAERTFHSHLHAEEVGSAFEAPESPAAGEVAGYTRDGSYLRLVRIGPRLIRSELHTEPNPNPPPPVIVTTQYIYVSEYQIQFPDGTRHTLTSGEYANESNTPPDAAFEKSLRYRVTRMEDRFGNSVTVDYTDDTSLPETMTTWTITEKAGATVLRTHTVNLGTDTFTQLGFSTQSRRRVDSVSLTAFDGKVVTYRFAYSGSKTISTPCVSYGPPPETTGNFLESVSATETNGGTTTTLLSYSMQYYDVIRDDTTGEIVCSQWAGHLRSLGLPTGGSIEYTAAMRVFPTLKDPDPAPGPDTNLNVSAAVATRTLVNGDGSREETRYRSHLHTPVTQFDPNIGGYRTISATHMTIAVTDPAAQVTYHHFYAGKFAGTSACFSGSVDERLYGLPLLKITGTAESDLLLSTETYDSSCATFLMNSCKPACKTAAGTIVEPTRRSYVKYDLDSADTSVLSDTAPFNQRLSASRTQFRDSWCGSQRCYTESRLADFDGLGHYRKETRSSNFPSTPVRETETRYNANEDGGSYPPAAGTPVSSYMIGLGSDWLLNLHDRVKVSQGGASAVTTICFDRATGFLERQRALSGTEPDSTDLLLVQANAAGNVGSQSFFGGDAVPLNAMADDCSDSPGTASYQIDHTYEAGVLKASEFVLDSAASLSALDLTIDGNTGLPKESRDPASVVTAYEYDALGRLFKVKPAGEAWTRYTYDLAARPASVAVETFANTVTDVTDATQRLSNRRLYYDGLGRLVQVREQLPSAWSVTEHAYDLLGRRKSTSIAVEAQSGTYEALPPGTKVTQYEYERFGRPGKITTPDGRSTDFSYQGALTVTRTVDVGGTPASTTETYDGHGRLVKVEEGPPNARVTASYAYDVGNRLTSVTMFDQTREVTYDGRGLLLKETHPETGVAGNGTTYYGTPDANGIVASEYDARGNALRRIVETAGGKYDLRYEYDRAGRLTKLQDLDPATGQRRTLESLAYASDNDTAAEPDDLRKGKLVTAIRNNYTSDMGAIEVKETYRYQNAAGRATRRDTTVGSTAQFAGASFTLTQSWNELGLPASVTYPSSASVPGAPTRVISNTYTAGRLTGVTGYAAISYQPTGLVDEITHGTSGVTETWQPDPNGMARPRRIEVTGPSGMLWTYGDYAYDGAGNITAIGNRAFGYDAMSRLISWKDTTPTGYTTVERTLDSFGNQLSSEWTGCTTVALGDCVSTRFKPFTAAASNHYAHQTHDDGGNVIADEVHQYVYDGTGMMTSISQGGRNDRYLYTAGGERIATVSRLQAGGTLRNRTTWTLRNTGNQLLRTFKDDSTSGTRVWSWTEDEIWRGTQLLASESPTGRKQYHVDHLGSPRFVTSTAGLRLGEQPFTPFGFGGTSDGGRIQFAGQEVDAAGDGEGLMYMHARYYSPGLGRFLSVDPVLDQAKALKEPQRWNRYSYVTNNPLRYVDPDGREMRFSDYVGAVWEATKQTVDDVAFATAYPVLKVMEGFITDNPKAIVQGSALLVGDAALGVAANAVRGGLWTSRANLVDHATRHAEMGFKTVAQYEMASYKFVASAGTKNVQTLTMKSGERFLYNAGTKEFAIVNKAGKIVDYRPANAKYWQRLLEKRADDIVHDTARAGAQ